MEPPSTCMEGHQVQVYCYQRCSQFLEMQSDSRDVKCNMARSEPELVQEF